MNHTLWKGFKNCARKWRSHFVWGTFCLKGLWKDVCIHPITLNLLNLNVTPRFSCRVQPCHFGMDFLNTQERTRNHNFKEERKKHPPTHLLNFHQTKRKCFGPSVVPYECYFYTIQQSWPWFLKVTAEKYFQNASFTVLPKTSRSTLSYIGNTKCQTIYSGAWL